MNLATAVKRLAGTARTCALLGLLAAGALLIPAEAGAQQSLHVGVAARVGLLAPDDYFYEQFTNFVGDGPMEWTGGSLGRSLVVGLGAEMEIGDSGILVRGEILRSYDMWLRVSHSIEIPRIFFEPPRIQTTWLDVPASMTLTSLQMVLPTRLELWGVQPYVFGGGGGKFYGFDDPTTPNDVEAVLPADGFTWGGDLGGGLTAQVLGLTLDLQVRDAISRYWGKTQNDFIFSGAGVFRLW